jgi:hypothetical protein
LYSPEFDVPPAIFTTNPVADGVKLLPPPVKVSVPLAETTPSVLGLTGVAGAGVGLDVPPPLAATLVAAVAYAAKKAEFAVPDKRLARLVQLLNVLETAAKALP